VNCAAIPEHLLESELFGHRRGAFTGATEDKQGLFEAAHGGTLFLDEVGELSLPVQAKLLRVLQDHNIRRLGDTTHRHVDVRIVAATNRDLRQEIAAQRFREDLFYRLNGVELRVPALRERPEDLRYLVRSLLTKAARSMKRPVEGYTPDALDALLAYRWPGNIRELENAIDRACALAVSSRIELAHLPDHVRHAPALPIAVLNIRTLRDIEREHILTTLQAVGGNRKRAAELLQIPLTTFFRKLRKLRITAQLVDRAIQNGTAVPD
jgi:transcriptional regulator with PAS, ATPase and Fis domain